MNWRERVSVSIPCFGIRFSAVLYITNAPSIQMIQQLLGSPVVYQFYDMRFLIKMQKLKNWPKRWGEVYAHRYRSFVADGLHEIHKNWATKYNDFTV